MRGMRMTAAPLQDKEALQEEGGVTILSLSDWLLPRTAEDQAERLAEALVTNTTSCPAKNLRRTLSEWA